MGSRPPDEFPVPVFWRTGVTRSFAEIPIDQAPYVSIEVQRVSYRATEGIMVALHRPSGALEIYAQPQLGLDKDWCAGDPAFAQFEVAVLADRNFDVARCQVVPGSVDMAVSFCDDEGRRIDAAAAHRSSRSAPALVTPAPLQADPATLRFLLMREFRMLPRRGSELRVTIDGRAAEPRPLLLPAAIAPFTQARMSTNLLMAGLLPNHVDRPLSPGAMEALDHWDRATTTGFVGDRLSEVGVANDHARFVLRFVDPLPHPEAVLAAGPAGGRFRVDSSLGPVAGGRWEMTAQPGGNDSGGQAVTFSLVDVNQDWAPPLTQPSRLALRQVRRLRRRRLGWSYQAELRPGPDGWLSTGCWSIANR